MHFFAIPAFYLMGALAFTTVIDDVSGQLKLQRGRRDENQSQSAVEEGACQTASQKSGSCVPLIRCRQYLGRSNISDITNSSCRDEISPRVCCPSIADDETTVTADISTKDSTTTLLMTTRSPTKTPTNVSRELSTDNGRRRGNGIFPIDCGRSGTTFSRIVGGQDSVLGAWPWMAVVYVLKRGGVWSPDCGGSLITSSHVITAAHCVVTSRKGSLFSPRRLQVRLGELDLKSDFDGANPIDIQIQSIIKHEKFNLRSFQNDIAILELVDSVEISEHISPICLPFNSFSEAELIDKNAIVAGWGSTRFGGSSSSILQEVQMRIWSNEECREIFRKYVPITNVNLCAGEDGKDACQADSGGPLMLPDDNGKFYLIGIVSFGKRCAEPGIPGVYTRVTEFIEWIEEKIG